MADADIVSQDTGIRHEYSFRRGIAAEVCNDKLLKWKELMSGERYACLGGAFVEKEEKSLQGKKIQVWGWIYDKLKTKKGCESYFENQCAKF